jgi:hypothetical protein
MAGKSMPFSGKRPIHAGIKVEVSTQPLDDPDAS